ncbi:hypothetical protein BX666DRAFT_1922202 [Dichotomocladium elegans]|nr:hypothetical protein BX666DRAFT_1922202 [Dichotomocladium elegans]
MYNRLLLLLTILLLSLHINAQMGPEITNPPYNGTVSPNEKVTIEYFYENMGTGNYTIDIAIWEDAAASKLIQNVTTDYKIEGGNSTGFQLAFNYTATYDWKVPKGLQITETFDNGTSIKESPQLIYLTVTLDTDTRFVDTRLRSRPIMLHYNAGTMAFPSFILMAALIVVGLGLVQ